MIQQFDQLTDAKLNGFESELSDILDRETDLKQRKDLLWEMIFGTFDAQVGNRPARFICLDGWVLSRELHQAKQTIDEDALKTAIFQMYPDAEARRLWNRITEPERHVVPYKVAKAIDRNHLSHDLVNSCLRNVGKVVPHRVRRPATQEDRAILEAMGETGAVVETKEVAS